MEPITAQPISPANPTSPYWADSSKYANQDIAKGLADIYAREWGQMDTEPGNFASHYQMALNDFNNTGDWRRTQQQNDIAMEPQGIAWRKPNPEQAIGDIAQFEGSRQNPLDMYNKALEGLGLTDARARVTGLRKQLLDNENLINNLEGDISGRTQGALVTENQRRKLLASEAAPLSQRQQQLSGTFDSAYGDYGNILKEGSQQTQFQLQGDSIRRQALMDRLQQAIERQGTDEDKRRWQAQFDQLAQQQALEAQQWERQFAESQRQFNAEQERLKASASSGAGGSARRSSGSSGSSGSGGSSSGSITQEDARNEFLGYIQSQMDNAPYSSRQVQDAWANAWFANVGVTDPQDRQFYWDAFNSNWNRPEDPYSDPFYAR